MKSYSVTEVLGNWFDSSKIADDVLTAACLRGTDTHTWCGGYAGGGYMLPPRSEIAGYCNSFVNWCAFSVDDVLLIEKRLTNTQLGFTGRPDFVFQLTSGETALVDIKTPAAEGKTWECQLAAYDALLESEAQIKVDALISLRLRIDGKPAIGRRYEGSRLAAYNAFLSALNAHRFING